MPRFTKTHDCPTSQSLLAYRDDALAPLAGQSVESHLGACEFCRAEFALLAHAGAHAPADAPGLPLALRLYAESRLAAINASVAFRRAA